ncbi:MAG: hypothetical protein AAFS13_03545 [Pseudomonadota bacterium]
MREPHIHQYHPPDQLTALEHAVVSKLCEEKMALRVAAREYTGVGVFVWFAPKPDETKMFSVPELHITTDDTASGLGVIAYSAASAETFEEQPAGLEIFSYDGPWWGDHTKFLVEDTNDTQE